MFFDKDVQCVAGPEGGTQPNSPKYGWNCSHCTCAYWGSRVGKSRLNVLRKMVSGGPYSVLMLFGRHKQNGTTQNSETGKSTFRQRCGLGGLGNGWVASQVSEWLVVFWDQIYPVHHRHWNKSTTAQVTLCTLYPTVSLAIRSPRSVNWETLNNALSNRKTVLNNATKRWIEINCSALTVLLGLRGSPKTLPRWRRKKKQVGRPCHFCHTHTKTVKNRRYVCTVFFRSVGRIALPIRS